MQRLLLILIFAGHLACPVGALSAADLFDQSNLAAWCIVPFDGKKRGPEERAAMLKEVGITKFVYDYRPEHLPQWDDEMAALKKHDIELLGWWFPTVFNDRAKETLELFKRHEVTPQLWVSGGGKESVEAESEADQEARIAREVKRLTPFCEAAAAQRLTVGLYNHGGWFGEPENQIAIIDVLKSRGLTNVGIVYNLHHGHGHLDRLPELLEAMRPHLICLNLNGMDVAGDQKGRKILPLGIGTEDVKVIRQISASGYEGPIGILNHTQEDAEGRLLDNLDGLRWILPQLDGKPPGAKPQYRTWSEPFTPVLAPLNPDDYEHRNAFVNRDRIFDFYSKQALHFMKQSQLPELIPPFPGMDGGKQGHWGNQNDQDTWTDGRWAKSDLGSVFSGVFKGAGLTIPKGVCVRYDDLAAVFDPTRLAFPVVWEDGFVSLNDRRRGFMVGAPMDGTVVAKSDQQREGRYLGFYRHGREVVFAYEDEDGRQLLNARGDGMEILAPLTAGGSPQWPDWIETRGEIGTGQPFATDRLTLPFENPYGTVFYLTAHDFFADGSAAIATMTGEVWLVRGIDETLEALRWKRFATGLHQPLGMKIIDGYIHVIGRDQITCLHDLNGDDEADYYECVTNTMETSRGAHDFVIGLEKDPEGRWIYTSGNEGLCRIGLDDRVEVLATGLRNPNGLGMSPDGRFLTTSGQEGDWTPASSVFQVELGKNEGAHFGAKGPKDGQAPEPVLLYLPRGEDNSSSSQAFINGEAWSSLAGEGNLVHLSAGGASAWLVMREQVNGCWQAAAMKISGNLDSGAQCARFHPGDGQLYITGLLGWGNYAPLDGCFQRVRFTGGTPVPVGFETRENGILVRFDEPIPESAVSRGETFAQCWNYRYSGAYGSPELSVRYPDKPGHDPLAIRSLHRLEEGRALFVEIPQLVPANQVHLRLATGQDIFLTLHELGEPFTAFPGYTKITKANAVATVGPAAPTASKPNPWAGGKPGRAIRIDAASGLQFAQREIRAKAGERVSLTFVNPDVVPHNWILAKPGSLQKVGERANVMITAPDGLARHYVPKSDDVLVWTDMINPKGEFTIHFDAPDQSGDYPYLCTFPGHWMIMNGVMKVE